mmetsp:Transcript_18125/g.30963  ORF Transcript_18125/g.30963 Transcript_18125/m.30963 type:complete len:124 (-) Transcript_18125:651-1022(-)
MRSSIDRNILQARILADKLRFEDLFQQNHVEHFNVRAQNIVRFYEKAFRSQSQFQLSQERESKDQSLLVQQDFTQGYHQILLNFYVALHYIQEQSTQGVFNALVILKNCLQKIQEAQLTQQRS